MAGYILSQGALETILNGGNYNQPIMQILDSKMVTFKCSGQQRNCIKLSDGTNTALASLCPKLNESIGSPNVLLFSIVRIESFCFLPYGQQQLLLILEMQTVVPGSIVGGKIGIPSAPDGTSVQVVNRLIYGFDNVSHFQNTGIKIDAVTNASAINILCNLSDGALEVIMKGGHYKQPIMQVLSSNRISNTHYRLLVSDGKNASTSFTAFSSRSEECIKSYSVVPFSIIRIKKWCVQRRPNTPIHRQQQVLLILNMQIVIPGSEIGRKIGSPKAFAFGDIAAQESNRFNRSRSINLHGLSWGALEIIMKGGDYEQPLLQVLDSREVASGCPNNHRYRVLLSDGVNTTSFVMLTYQSNGNLGPNGIPLFSIIRLGRFITSVVNNSGKGEQRVLLILETQIVAPGANVGEKIGSPKSLDDASAVKPVSKNPQTFIVNGKSSESIMRPSTTSNNTANNSDVSN